VPRPRQPEPYFDRQIEVYQIALRTGVRSPFLADHELVADAAEDSVAFRIDVDGLADRIRGVPVEPGNYRSLAVNGDALFMLSLDSGPSPDTDLLAVMIAMSGIFSAILTNDVVVVAMVPLLVHLCQARGLNPVPFLLGFAFAANGGSAGTIIGSPQNMIVAEALHLSFLRFMKGAMLPALLSLPVIWVVMVVLYRGRWTAPAVTRSDRRSFSARGASRSTRRASIRRRCRDSR